MDLSLSLRRAAAVHADSEAYVDGEKRSTYKEFGQSVASLAAGLAAMGILQGETVGIVCPNGHQYLESYYACAVSGIVLNPINFRLAAREIATILIDSESKALIVHQDFYDLLKNALDSELGADLKDLKIIFIGTEPPAVDNWHKAYLELFIETADAHLPERIIAGADLAQLYYTSGTTGKAKGVMLTHDNVASHALASLTELGLTDEDTWAHIGPMFHLLDAWSVFAATWAGARHVFVSYFEPEAVLDLLVAEKVTKTALVPTMLNSMLNSPSLADRKFPDLKFLMTAGSPVAPEIVKRACLAFECEYLQFYGMTETSPFLTISKPPSSMKDASLDQKLTVISRTGRTFIGVELKVIREDGTHVDCDDIDVGEIVVRGPSVTPGYWKQKEATEATIRGGWLYTGDLAVMDSTGSVNIVDRKKDMIITGGENVYSTEVEYAIYEHPDVVECAVFGIPDQKWGEKVKAVIVKKADSKLTEEEVIAFIRTRLAAYKAPRAVEFIDALPKTGSGKIYKKGLKDSHWQEHARPIN
ncbi:MAG: long-chain-fatty-acid--CoA ligase [Leptolyngbya sp.]|nr:long-chain-fatty-acid--CoA ligase [Candidatus Melainabacteria bacterium]